MNESLWGSPINRAARFPSQRNGLQALGGGDDRICADTADRHESDFQAVARARTIGVQGLETSSGAHRTTQ
jgi:hypothetical protein